MTDAREIAADVSFEHLPYLLRHDLRAQSLQRVVKISARPKAVTAIQEICFEHGFQNARYRSLQQSVRGRWYSQLPFPSSVLVDLHRPDRRWKVAARRHPIPDLVEVVLQLPLEALNRLLVDTCCSLIGFNLLICLPYLPLGNTVWPCLTHRFLPLLVDASSSALQHHPFAPSFSRGLHRYYGCSRPCAAL